MSVTLESNVVPPISASLSAEHVFSTPKVPIKTRERSSSKKKISSQSQLQSKISVYCRPRPIGSSSTCISQRTDTKLTLVNGNTYTYDYVFHENAPQTDVYDRCAREMVEAFMREQRSCLLFCYGVSGSGKTYTIEGDNQNPGIVPKLMKDLSSTQLSPNTTLNLSYFEIYQESIYDLMEDIDYDPYTHEPVKRKKLKVIEGKDGFIEFVSNEKGEQRRELKKIELKKLSDAVQIWRHFRENRSVSGTALNDDSSRSHSVFMVRMFEKLSSGLEREVARLSIVDLAGSERVIRSRPTQEQQSEAGSINNSLIMLSEYLKTIRSSISVGKPLPFISCRGSKLTRLFQDTFTRSRSMIRLVVNVNPDIELISESDNALKFGAIASGVDTTPLSALKSSSKKLDAFVSPRLLAPIRNSTTPRLNSMRKKKSQISDENSQLDTKVEQINATYTPSSATRNRTPLKVLNKNDIPSLVLKESEIRKNVVHLLDSEIKKQERSQVRKIEMMRLQYQKREARQISIYSKIIKRLKLQISSIVTEKNNAIQAMKESIEKLNNEIFSLKDNYDKGKIVGDDSSNIIEELKSIVKAKESEIASLQQSISTIESNLNSKLQEKEALLVDANDSKVRLERSFKEHIAAQKTKFDVERKLLESNSVRLKEEISSLKKLADEDKKQRTKDSKLSKTSKTKGRDSHMEEIKMKLTKEFESKFKDMEHKLEMQKKQSEELTLRQHTEMSQLANKHSQEIYVERQKRTELLNELNALKSKHEAATQQENSVKRLEEENSTLKQTIEALQKELASNKEIYSQQSNLKHEDGVTELSNIDPIVESSIEVEIKDEIMRDIQEVEAAQNKKKSTRTQRKTQPKNSRRRRNKNESDTVDQSTPIPLEDEDSSKTQNDINEEPTLPLTRKRAAAKRTTKKVERPQQNAKGLLNKVVNSLMSPIQTRNGSKRKLRRFSTIESDDEFSNNTSSHSPIQNKRRRLTEDNSLSEQVNEEKNKKPSKTKKGVSKVTKKLNDSVDDFAFLNETDESSAEDDTGEWVPPNPSASPAPRRITRRGAKRAARGKTK